MVALFVLLTFLLFITVDLFVLKAQKKRHPAFTDGYSTSDVAVFTKETLYAPLDLFLSKGHTWAKKNEYGLIKIGIDEFIIKALGKISLLNFAKPEKKIQKGDVIFEAAAGNKTFQFRSPVSGVVKFINPQINNKKISDPYGEDWGILVAADNFVEAKDSLFTGSNIKTFLNSEFSRLKDFLHHHTMRPELAGATMLDGGNVVEGVVSSINEKGIDDFQTTFLSI